MFNFRLLWCFLLVVNLCCTSDNDRVSTNKMVESLVTNSAPTAEVQVDKTSGDRPLQVNFTGSESSDDKGIETYLWDFKDGTSSSDSNPSHTFIDSGKYLVELTVSDEEGLTDNQFVEINIVEPNIAPIAVAKASTLEGEAPLQVKFTGRDSADDTFIENFLWNISGNMTSTVDPYYTFFDPGTYDVSLEVTDAEGLTDIETLSITVTENSSECFTNGSFAGAEGLKTWCWANVTIPQKSFFSGDQLAISSHCNDGMVTSKGDRIFFKVNPTVPNAINCSSFDFNYRSEIRDAPSDVNHPLGTEQWWGFDYSFDHSYIPDELPWILWQTHGSFSNPGDPMTSLQIGPTNYAGNIGARGELYVSNAAISTGNAKFFPTGIIPQAGQTLKIVIHLVWGDDNIGLYQVWVDGVKVYDEHERTVYAEKPEGGYWKMGIYKWRWQKASNVDLSSALGISELKTSIGPLRVIKKSPNNASYLSDEYETVKPY